MLKLIHAADFHLDSPFSGLSPEQAARRRGEQRQLLEDLAALARDRQADLVLLAGDLLDSEQVYRETAQALAQALGSIPCPVFISPGNHDFYSPRSVYATLSWPENVHIFTRPEVECVPLPDLNCTVYGRAFTAPHDNCDPLRDFRAQGEGLQVMCLHGDVTAGERYAPLAPESIAWSGLSYLALGHVHQCSGVQTAGSVRWAYPGCPEGRGFDEAGEKGVIYAELDEESFRWEFIPLCRRRYQILTVDLTGQSDPLGAITAQLPGGTAGDVYRIVLTGSAPAPDLAGLEQALAPRFYALSLRDRTRLPQDLWQRRGEDNLTGLFLQAMWEKCQADPDDPVARLAARFGLSALENGEEGAL